MYKQTESTVFKVLSIFLTFTVLWNAIAYAAGGDIGKCLAVRTPFEQVPTTPTAEQKESSFGNMSQMKEFNQHLAYALLFNIIAMALNEKNPLDRDDVIRLIEEHLNEYIQAGFLKPVKKEELEKRDNAFYLTRTVQNQKYKFKFFRIDKAESGQRQFSKKLIIEDGTIGIEVIGKEDSIIDKHIREAFNLAVKIGSKEYAFDKSSPMGYSRNQTGDSSRTIRTIVNALENIPVKTTHRSAPSPEDDSAIIQQISSAIIEELGNDYIRNVHHGLKHAEDLTKKAKILIKELKIENQIDWKVLTSAIYLHDIKADKKTHGKEGADFAEQLLRKLDLLDKEQIKKVKDAIILHEIRTEDGISGRQEAGFEAQILYEIDSWDAFGIKGVYRFLTIYRKRSVAYEKILKNVKARYNNLIFDATRKLAKDDYEYIKSFFTK
ncbi:MAG: hypothetical protein JSV93_02035, partial [Candidatus Omnitrophota bacterium]